MKEIHHNLFNKHLLKYFIKIQLKKNKEIELNLY